MFLYQASPVLPMSVSGGSDSDWIHDQLNSMIVTNNGDNELLSGVSVKCRISKIVNV